MAGSRAGRHLSLFVPSASHLWAAPAPAPSTDQDLPPAQNVDAGRRLLRAEAERPSPAAPSPAHPAAFRPHRPGPGQVPAMPRGAAGAQTRGAGAAAPFLHPPASTPRSLGRPQDPYLRAGIGLRGAGRPSSALGAAEAAGRGGGGGCRGEERRRHVTACRASPAYCRAGPLPPLRPRCARPPGRRRSAEGGAAAGPGRAALLFTNSPRERGPDRTLKAGSPTGFRHFSRELR